MARVMMPSPAVVSAELADAALKCPALSHARRLAEWVGPGKELTSSGVPKPAAAVEACRVLGISLPKARLRSALDVDELMRTWLVALAAGFVVSDGRRVRATATLDGAKMTGPAFILNAWVRAAAGVFGLPGDPCAGCLIVLHELSAASQPLSMDELAGAIAAADPGSDADEACPDCGDVHDLDLFAMDGPDEEDDLEHAMGIVAKLADFGAATTSTGASGLTPAGRARLTPLGSMLASAVFEGCAPPRDADAKSLISVLSELPPPVAMIMAKPWLGARSADAAVRELLTFAESASGSQRLAALAVAETIEPNSMIAWREWASRPGFGAYARQWLADHGNPVAVNPQDESWLIVDGLSIMLDSLGDDVPPFLLAAALQQELGADMAEAMAALRACGHPAADDIAARLGGPNLVPVERATRKKGRAADAVCELKISLRNVSEPEVWRRVVVPEDITLGELNYVILEAMGWDGGHLHMFRTRLGEYGTPGMELGYADEFRVRLADVLPRRGSKLLHSYDFGDDWEHDIRLEHRRPGAPGDALPSCIAGEGACPPDDCGGPWGYDRLKEVVANPDDEDHVDMLDWLGLDEPGQFDPAAFSLDEVNSRLRQLNTELTGG